jgi:hypothetical protein
MLLTGSGGELCGLLLALFQAAAYYPPVLGPSASVSSQFCSYWEYSGFLSLNGVGRRVIPRTGAGEADSLLAAICHAT